MFLLLHKSIDHYNRFKLCKFICPCGNQSTASTSSHSVTQDSYLEYSKVTLALQITDAFTQLTKLASGSIIIRVN